MSLTWIPGRPSSLTNYCFRSGLSSAHGNTSGVKLPHGLLMPILSRPHGLPSHTGPHSLRPTTALLSSPLCELRPNLVLPAHPNTAQEATPQLLWSSASQISPQRGPPNTPASLQLSPLSTSSSSSFLPRAHCRDTLSLLVGVHPARHGMSVSRQRELISVLCCCVPSS